jgi:O-antigen/teichoic acid export membrane protein
MPVRIAFIRMISSRLVVLVLMSFGFAVLGRLLPPSAFGHFALAMAIYTLAQTTVQFGLRQYIVRSEEDPPRETIAAAVGLSLSIAAALCALGLVGAAFLGGWLLPEPTAAALVPLSFSLLVRPFLLGSEALLQRSMRFELIAVVEVVRVAVDVATAVSLALLGFGAVGLATATLLAHIAGAALLLGLSGREKWIWPRFGAWRGLGGWGGLVTVIQLQPKVTDLILVTALSAWQGPQVLGLFNRARTIHQILDRTLFEGIRPVILPAISGALRGGMAPSRLYLVKLDYLMAICWPGFALIALMAEPLVAVLLGSQWGEVVPTVRILALMGLALPVTKMSQKLFVALNETAVYLRLQLMQDLVRLPLALIGALVSLEAFAAAYVAGNWIKALGISWHLHRRFGGDGGHRRVAARAAAVTLASLVGPAAVLRADLSPAATLLAALPLAGVGWLAGVALLKHPIFGEMRDVAMGIRRAMPRLASRF